MINELKKLYIFFERDVKILFSYKLALFFMIFNTVMTVVYLVLFGKMFGLKSLPILEPYGGNFISYILIGAIGWEFLISITSAGYSSITDEMQTGTIESILLTPTSIFTIVMAYIINGSLMGLLSISVLLAIGILLFNTPIYMNIYGLLIMAISSVMMIGFSFIIAGLNIRFKNVGPVFAFFQSIAMVFSEVYFPLKVLPEFFQPVAYCIPFYYPIIGLRTTLMPHCPFSLFLKYFLIIGVLSIFFLILGNRILKLEFNKAKREGTLAYY